MLEKTSAQDEIQNPILDPTRDAENLTMAVFQETRPDHSPLKKLCSDDRASTPRRDSDHNVPAQVEDIHIQTPPVKISDPDFRVLPHGSHCLRKTLNSKDVSPMNPELHLDSDEAFIVSCSKKILESAPGSCKRSLLVFDEGRVKYSMILSKYERDKCAGYSISGEWERFVKAHNLQAGDKLSFYRTLGGNNSDALSYILKYVRKCSDSKDIDAQKSKKPRIKFDQKKAEVKVRNRGADLVDNKRKRNVIMPYYCSHQMRAMTRDAYCLSKTLTSIEVVHRNSKLYFDPYAASVLIDTPEIGRYPLIKYSKDLQVLDKNGRTYFMTLSHCISGGEIRSYCISSGWERFLRAHKLKEGDVLTFYRFRDTAAFKLKYYYVLKYFVKPRDVVDQCMNNKTSDYAKIKLKGTVLMSKKKQEPKVGDNEVLMENAYDQKKINTHKPGSRKLSDVLEPCKNSKASEDPDKKDTHKGSTEVEVGNIAQKDNILVSKKTWEPEIRDNEVRMENDCDREKIKVHGLAGSSRDLMYGVHEGNLKLCFDANEAWHSTDKSVLAASSKKTVAAPAHGDKVKRRRHQESILIPGGASMSPESSQPPRKKRDAESVRAEKGGGVAADAHLETFSFGINPETLAEVRAERPDLPEDFANYLAMMDPEEVIGNPLYAALGAQMHLERALCLQKLSLEYLSEKLQEKESIHIDMEKLQDMLNDTEDRVRVAEAEKLAAQNEFVVQSKVVELMTAQTEEAEAKCAHLREARIKMQQAYIEMAAMYKEQKTRLDALEKAEAERRDDPFQDPSQWGIFTYYSTAFDMMRSLLERGQNVDPVIGLLKKALAASPVLHSDFKFEILDLEATYKVDLSWWPDRSQLRFPPSEDEHTNKLVPKWST